MAAPETIRTDRLDVAVRRFGPADGPAAILLHGFPYDAHSFDAVGRILGDAGMRVIVPFLRGFGGTRFRDADAMRSGEQAALAEDLRGLMDTLALPRALLAGFDWGGRAACAAAALWPERVSALAAIGGYLIQDNGDPSRPAPAAIEQLAWHQYYLASARGRRALEERRDELCRHFWQIWSPGVPFDEAAFATASASFANPDFAAIAWHSYAHRIGAAPGDPLYAETEARLRGRPAIDVPSLVVRGGAAMLGGDARPFTRLVASVTIDGAGHNPPLERPRETSDAILRLASDVAGHG